MGAENSKNAASSAGGAAPLPNLPTHGPNGKPLTKKELREQQQLQQLLRNQHQQQHGADSSNGGGSVTAKAVGGNVPLDGNDAENGGGGMFELSVNPSYQHQSNGGGIVSEVASSGQFVVKPEALVAQQSMYANAPAPHPTISQQQTAVQSPPPQQQQQSASSSSPTSQQQTRSPVRLTQSGIAQTALNFTLPPLGQGGFSVVHQGKFFNEPVAVKVLNIRNPQEHAMFTEELRAMLNPTLWHGNICPLLAYCDTAPAFVFPRLTAVNVERMVRLPDDVKDTICVDVAHGLAHMHRAGYVHMDMKPDNVLLLFDEQRRIKKGLVGDLGCAKATSVPVLPFGTIVFLDPQLRFDVPKNPHPADDVFSLGITYLCMWTNRIPGVREEIPALMALLQSADTFRYTMVAAMTSANPNLRPTCAYVAEVLQARQQYSWQNKLYPWSSKGIPPITQPPFVGTVGQAVRHQLQQFENDQRQQQQQGVVPSSAGPLQCHAPQQPGQGSVASQNRSAHVQQQYQQQQPTQQPQPQLRQHQQERTKMGTSGV